MVNEHPWATLSFFGLGILAVFWLMKRLFLDDDSTLTKVGKRLD
jgi:hypothetical protein